MSGAGRAGSPGASRLRDCLALAGLALVTLAFWKLRILDPASESPLVRNLGNVDLFTYIVPVATGIRDSWLSGELPLWNPYQGAGHPALATLLPGSLYPFNFPYLLFEARIAVELVAVLHLSMGAVFMYMLARVWGLGRIACVVAATTFVLSGFVVSRANWFPPALAASIWLPASLLAADRVVRGGGSRWVVALAASIAMPILAGWLQLWTYSMYALVLYCGLHWIAAGRVVGSPGRLRMVGLLGLGAGLGLALAAVQLLPSFELQALSPRRTGSLSTSEMMLFGGTAPGQLIASATNAVVGPPRWTYLGIPALILIPLSLLARGMGVRLAALWSILALGAGVALTVHTEWGRAFLSVPSAQWFREPQRIVFLYAFAGAALAGVGTHVLSSLDRNRHRRWLVPVVVLSVAALVSLSQRPSGPTHALLWSSALLALAGSLIRSPGLHRGIVGVLALLAVADPFLATRNTNRHPFHEPGLQDQEQSVFAYLRSRQGLDRSLLLGGSRLDFAMMAKHGTLERIYSATDYEPLSLARRARFFRLLDRDESARSRRPFSGWLDPDITSSKFDLLDLMSVRFLVLHHLNRRLRSDLAERSPIWSLARPRKGGQYVVYENRGALPRAYLAFHGEAAASQDDALSALTSADFDPRQSVVLEGLSATVALPALSGVAIEPVRIVRYEPKRVIVEAELSRRGVLVLTDTVYPGWIARVNGTHHEVLTANAQFRAVVLEPGKHRVEFVYRPSSVRLGGATTLVALVVAGLLYLRQRR